LQFFYAENVWELKEKLEKDLAGLFAGKNMSKGQIFPWAIAPWGDSPWKFSNQSAIMRVPRVFYQNGNTPIPNRISIHRA
jgi:hypothetical protein